MLKLSALALDQPDVLDQVLEAQMDAGGRTTRELSRAGGPRIGCWQVGEGD